MFKSLQILILPLLLLFLSISCGELTEYENQQVQKALSDSLFTTTESWGIRMEILEEEKLKLKLTGSYAATIKNENRNITKISGPVYIKIYNEAGVADTFVDADSAVHKPEEAIFELFGNVFVRAPENKRLWSEYLKWDRTSDRISTPQFLTIVTPTDSITAIGLDGDTNLNNYTLREVTGETVVD